MWLTASFLLIALLLAVYKLIMEPAKPHEKTQPNSKYLALPPSDNCPPEVFAQITILESMARKIE